MGRRGTSLVAAGIILLLISAQAEAKAPPLKDALQTCARIQNPTDRLSCFDELARSSASDASGQAATDAAKTAPIAPMTATAQRAASEDRRKHAKGSGQTREAYAAVVMRAWESPTGDYYIALTNGEIWKSEAHKVRPVRDREEVELSPGAVGGWFMQFKTLKRPTIRVSLAK